jgi:hypothetical protein
MSHTYLRLYATYGYISSRRHSRLAFIREPNSMHLAAHRTMLAKSVIVHAGPPTRPFESAEHAWLWTMAALIARREGARFTANKGAIARPCEPDDIVKCLDALYRQGRIELAHARVLRVWGERQMPPSLSVAAERRDHAHWAEALERLTWPLRIKGIVS